MEPLIVVDWILRILSGLFFALCVGMGVTHVWNSFCEGDWFDGVLFSFFTLFLTLIMIASVATKSSYRERREGILVPCPTCEQETRADKIKGAHR